MSRLAGWLTRQGEQFPDSVQGETELTAMADKIQTFQVVGSIGPVATGGSRGGGEHADLLVPPNERNFAAGFTGQIANGEGHLGHRPIVAHEGLHLQWLEVP